MSRAFHDQVNTFKTPEMYLYLASDVWAGCFTIIFAGSFHYFKLVSCWIQFCENVAGVPRSFGQLQSRVGKVNIFKTPEMHLYLASDVWARCFAIIFAGSFHYFKLVSCWIQFCENVAGVPRPFDQLQSCVGKVNTFETPEMHLYFDSDVLHGCLTIIFVGSFLHFKFLTKINSKVRRK